MISGVSPNEINTNNTTTTLTITGTNLATTDSIYIDFNNNNTADSGEACTVKAITSTQIACTAPSRTTAGGPYTIGLTTDGGSASKASAVSYVTPVPTVTSVSPESFLYSDHDLTFTITGKNLGQVSSINLYGYINMWEPRGLQVCRLSRVTDTQVVCTVSNHRFDHNMWEDMTVSARFYDSSNNQLLYVEKFSRITNIWGD